MGAGNEGIIGKAVPVSLFTGYGGRQTGNFYLPVMLLKRQYLNWLAGAASH